MSPFVAAESQPVGSPSPSEGDVSIEVLEIRRESVLPLWAPFAGAVSRDLRWVQVLRDGLGHRPYLIVARTGNELSGVLPLSYVSGPLFGRFLVSLPYLNSGGVDAKDADVEARLIDEAVSLADRLNVKFLELRHERESVHPALTATLTSKVHMRLRLPGTAGKLWKDLKPKVRNQVRRGQDHAFDVAWGRDALLDDFYRVLCRNMRDLGTPIYSRRLFASIVKHFAKEAEICCLLDKGRPIAAALLLHGRGVTEVPTASSLRSYNSSNANMLMYWHLLERAVDRGQLVFDFGRSTVDGNTFRFKKQWGAQPEPAIWQYHVRKGAPTQMRPESGRFGLAVKLWRKLPVAVASALGPYIVRGIP